VYSEVAQVLHLPLLSGNPEKISVDSFSDLQTVFSRIFPPLPDSSSVRNWSSMGQRKKPTIGHVKRKFQWISELHDGVSSFFFIDWLAEFPLNAEVKYLSFPNPSVCERPLLPTLIKPLNTEDEPSSLSAATSTGGRDGNSSSLDSLLIEWVKSSSPEIPAAPIGISGRRPDWIPDTPATPLYLQQEFSASSVPPSALLDLLRAAEASFPSYLPPSNR
jgi:hypothetical protein